MIIIVGLGNPGDRYANTRHNLGFMTVDELARTASDWRFSKKFNAEICRTDPDILLVKPQTMMNASGRAVAKIAQYYQVADSAIWIVHDDADLPLGKLKIRLGGAAAGHHGVESVIKELGTDRFVRFRLGIGEDNRGADGSLERFVLRRITGSERVKNQKLIKTAVKAIKKALAEGIERAMNEFNA